jgi:uncharacterized protein DUF6982
LKSRAPASTLKKVVVQRLDRSSSRGYLNAALLGRSDSLDLLTPEGEHEPVELKDVKCVYFVREFTDEFEPERKAFFSRPKLEGVWVRLTFRDGDTIEGIVANNLLELLDRGVQITPPDLHGDTMRIFIPRTALTELTVLGVVGASRREPKRVAAEVAARQPRLFGE